MQGWLQTKYIATLDLYLGIKSKFLLNIETTDSRLCTDLMKGLRVSPMYIKKTSAVFDPRFSTCKI